MESFNVAKLALLKIRKITKKVNSVVTCLLHRKKQRCQQQKAEPMTLPANRLVSWEHPSSRSDYVDCCQFEADENALNEALEAKLRQLIVTEYANRRPTAPVSLHIQGHLTITPTQQEGTFWTTTTADADICWRDSAVSQQQQKAERQTPLLF